MSERVAGIHHVTAIADDPQRNVDFYCGVLGLRLVKKTVNFDDPGSYHLYYGDDLGRPGTILTFFAWPGAPRGRRGTGQTTVTSFSVPPDSLRYWEQRLTDYGLPASSGDRLGDKYLATEDFDGLALELVVDADARSRPAWAGPVDLEHAVRGFRGVTLSVRDHHATAQVLAESMGFQLLREDGNWFRYQAQPGQPGSIVDVVREPEGRLGQVAVGTVHHVAWRASDDRDQLAWRDRLLVGGLEVTPVIDRCYFHSIYFREPGGVLFEIATEPPGFTIDEPQETLGSSLQLPTWLEEQRAALEAHLPPISPRPFPAGAAGEGS